MLRNVLLFALIAGVIITGVRAEMYDKSWWPPIAFAAMAALYYGLDRWNSRNWGKKP